MPTVVYPKGFWVPGGPATLHTQNSGAWVPSTADANHRIGLTMFTRAPVFFDHDAFFEAAAGTPWRSGDALSVPPASLGDLLVNPAWSVPVVDNDEELVVAATLPYSVDSPSTNIYRIVPHSITLPDDDEHYQDFQLDVFRAPIVAMAFWVDGTINSIVRPLLAIVRFDDPLLVQGSASSPCYVSVPQELVSYRYETSSSVSPAPGVGALGVKVPMLEWESARAAHVWMKPQRVNMVANPSFELGIFPYSGTYSGNSHTQAGDSQAVWENGTWGWRTNGAMSSITSDTPAALGPSPRNRCCDLSRGSLPSGSTLVLESNLFPSAVAQDQWFSVEASVAGVGRVRIGLVFFDLSGAVGGYSHSDWVQVNSQNSFVAVKALIPLADRSREALFRLEFQGPYDECWVDNVMVDNNAAQLGYFDGNWFTGQPGDFSWYGPPHRSFSVYYNDRRNVDSYLFGYNELGPKDGLISELPLSTPDVPPPTLVVDHTSTVRDVRDLLVAASEVSALVQAGSTILGQININDLTRVVRHHGRAWEQVPEGAQVVPQWDDVYGLQIPSWPGDLYIRLWDFQDGTASERKYKTTVTAV